MWKHLYVKYPLFFSYFNQTWIPSIDFLKILKYKISWNSVQWGAGLFRADGRTDRHVEANSRFTRTRIKMHLSTPKFLTAGFPHLFSVSHSSKLHHLLSSSPELATQALNKPQILQILATKVPDNPTSDFLTVCSDTRNYRNQWILAASTCVSETCKVSCWEYQTNDTQASRKGTVILIKTR